MGTLDWLGDAVTVAAGSWLGTYWVHAALLHIAAIAFARFGRLPLRARDRLWRTALLLPLLTATTASVIASTPATIESLQSTPGHGAPPPMRVTVQSQASVTDAITSEVVVRRRTSPLPGVTLLIFLVVGVPAATLQLRRSRRAAQVRRASREDAAVFASQSLDIGAGRQARIWLADLPRAMGAAFATGTRDIVVSREALRGLSPESRRAVLCHELAHLRRRDPIWLGVAAWIGSVFAFQPSARLVIARMRRDAEFASDRMAVDRLGSLTRYLACLTTLATPFDAAEHAAFATSLVVQRAQQLFDREPEGRRVSWWPWAAMAVLGVFLTSIPVMARPAAAVSVSTILPPHDGPAQGPRQERSIVVRVESAIPIP